MESGEGIEWWPDEFTKVEVVLDQKTLDRLVEKFTTGDDPNGCWEWQAAKTRGRGVIYVNGRQQYATRVVQNYLVEEIPDGWQVDHLCFNISCVNPDHLESVSPVENHRRAREYYAKGEYSPLCPSGHDYEKSGYKIDHLGNRRCLICYRDWKARWAKSAKSRNPEKFLENNRRRGKAHRIRSGAFKDIANDPTYISPNQKIQDREVLAEIVSRVKSGESRAFVAESLGLPAYTVARYYRKYRDGGRNGS